MQLEHETRTDGAMQHECQPCCLPALMQQRTWTMDIQPLHLDASTWRTLLAMLGPSLGLWRAAEVAALREANLTRPILDLGCGDGLVTAQVVSQVEVGLDRDPQALARAARRGLYARCEATAADEAPLASDSIATVISNSVLEHVPSVERVLGTVARVLRPGGRLIFTVPSEAFGASLALCDARYTTWRNRQLGHLNLWTVERWAEALDCAGMEVEVIRPYLRPGLVRVWDVLDLTEHVHIAEHRAVSVLWRRLPASQLNWLARAASHVDLSSYLPGGGRLITARKR